MLKLIIPNINICLILNKRNMRKIIEPMQEFGATFMPKKKKNFPKKKFDIGRKKEQENGW